MRGEDQAKVPAASESLADAIPVSAYVLWFLLLTCLAYYE